MLAEHTGRTGRVLPVVLLACTLRGDNVPEVSITAEDFKRLDVFEAQVLGNADKVFASREYRRAAADYEAFVQQFPKTGAVPYALLKKGRSIQYDGKRYEAIRVYEEVLDYFPNNLPYAAPALYYTGECHWQNGDVKEAMKAWAEMADDADYSKHYLAAPALNALGRNLADQDKAGEAVKYWTKAAVTFRRSSPDPAREAMRSVAWYYVRKEPNEPKLAEFYKQVGTFEHDPRGQEKDERLYWSRVMDLIAQHGTFPDEQKDLRARFYRYWAKAMEGLLPDWDDFQVARSGYLRSADGDDAAWVRRMDELFAARQKPDDMDRVVRFLVYFARDRKRGKFDEYYAKLNFAKTGPDALERLVRAIYECELGTDLARNVFGRIPLDKLDDNAKYGLGRWLWNRDSQPLPALYNSYRNREAGQMELLRFYHWARNLGMGLPLADEIAKAFPGQSREALYLKGEIQQHHRKFEDAIRTFQASDYAPHSLWRIGECYQGMGKPESAIAQYREVENFFRNEAPEAALRIAWVRRDTGDQKGYIAALRAVLKKYPQSGQSSTAHQELERLGVKIGGGVEAE
jgi:TolA-binding protein